MHAIYTPAQAAILNKELRAWLAFEAAVVGCTSIKSNPLAITNDNELWIFVKAQNVLTSFTSMVDDKLMLSISTEFGGVDGVMLFSQICLDNGQGDLMIGPVKGCDVCATNDPAKNQTLVWNNRTEKQSMAYSTVSELPESVLKSSLTALKDAFQAKFM